MTDLALADVSEFQPRINWPAYGQQNRAVIVRAAYGHRQDYWFTYNQGGARANCDVIGYYQYLPAAADPRTCAMMLEQIVGPLLPGREFLVLDLEEGSGDQSGRMDAWNSAIASQFAKVDYSGLSFWHTHLNNVQGAVHRWVAAYGQSEPTSIAHDLWQDTDRQQFAGVAAPCDGSIFHGTIDDLKNRLGLALPPTPVPPPPPLFDASRFPFPGNMGLGSIGPQVAELKVFLTAAGFGHTLNTSTPKDQQTYGQGTQAAVALLQGVHDGQHPAERWFAPGVQPDGTCGQRTWTFLLADLVWDSALRGGVAA